MISSKNMKFGCNNNIIQCYVHCKRNEVKAVSAHSIEFFVCLFAPCLFLFVLNTNHIPPPVVPSSCLPPIPFPSSSPLTALRKGQASHGQQQIMGQASHGQQQVMTHQTEAGPSPSLASKLGKATQHVE